MVSMIRIGEVVEALLRLENEDLLEGIDPWEKVKGAYLRQKQAYNASQESNEAYIADTLESPMQLPRIKTRQAMPTQTQQTQNKTPPHTTPRIEELRKIIK